MDEGELQIKVDEKVKYSGSVDLGYSGPTPPYNSIALWIKNKSSFRLKNKKGRFIRKTPGNINRAAFNIAKKIGREGYLGSNYVGISYINIASIISKSLSEAYADDIARMLKENISTNNP